MGSGDRPIGRPRFRPLSLSRLAPVPLYKTSVCLRVVPDCSRSLSFAVSLIRIGSLFIRRALPVIETRD